MEYLYELKSPHYIARFHIRQCAEVFKQIHGGEINMIQVQDDDSDLFEIKQFQTE